VHPAHPLRVAAGEVVVDRDDVHAPARQGVEVGGQHAGQGLALAGAHLGDVAHVQRGAAHDLHVEVPLAQRAAGRLPGDREGLHEDVVDGLAVGEPLPEDVGLRPQLGVGHRDEVVLDPVDGVGDGLEPAQGLALTGAQELLQDHVRNLFLTGGTASRTIVGGNAWRSGRVPGRVGRWSPPRFRRHAAPAPVPAQRRAGADGRLPGPGDRALDARPSPYTAEHARSWVEQVSPNGWDDGTTASFAVPRRDDGQAAGQRVAHGHRGRQRRGRLLDRGRAPAAGASRRRPSGPSAAGLRCAGLQRVLWRAGVGNYGSRAVAERCGFTIEGRLRLAGVRSDGTRRDDWYGSLLVTDEVGTGGSSARGGTAQGTACCCAAGGTTRRTPRSCWRAARTPRRPAGSRAGPVHRTRPPAGTWRKSTRGSGARASAAPLAVEQDGGWWGARC
jgi:hypothetical protein